MSAAFRDAGPQGVLKEVPRERDRLGGARALSRPRRDNRGTHAGLAESRGRLARANERTRTSPRPETPKESLPLCLSSSVHRLVALGGLSSWSCSSDADEWGRVLRVPRNPGGR